MIDVVLSYIIIDYGMSVSCHNVLQLKNSTCHGILRCHHVKVSYIMLEYVMMYYEGC